MSLPRWTHCVPALGLLFGCSLERGLLTTLGPEYHRPNSPSPSQWQAALPLPHSGSVDNLRQWWLRFQDPVLSELIAASERAGADLAQAAARIERARSDAVAADAQPGPSLDASGAAERSAFSFGGPPLQQSQIRLGARSSWEIDLFGGLARSRQAARAQVAAARAAWHDARVSTATETATAYLNFRYCEVQTELSRRDLASRAETERLIARSVKAGFQPATAQALADSTLAEASSNLASRREACDVAVKALVALTGQDEPALRQALDRAQAHPGVLPRAPAVAINAVPAAALGQRPDVAQAERSLAAASAQIGVAEANRYPSLALTGSITQARSGIDGSPAFNLRTWSIGPSLRFPLLDGGQAAANAKAARAEYAAAESVYRARVRRAVREVEEALVHLGSVAARLPEAKRAQAGYRASLDAARIREQAGLASRLEREEGVRAAIAADATVASVEYDGVATWISLYRAMGGGWDGDLGTSTASNL